MKLYINASAGLNQQQKKAVEDLGILGVRSDVQEHSDITAMCNFYKDTDLSPLFVMSSRLLNPVAIAVALKKAGVEKKAAVEVVNEPDLNGWSPEEYAHRVTSSHTMIKNIAPEITVVSGGISNLGTAQLAYLRRAVTAGMHSDVMGYHTYRTTETADTPLKGYKNREEELIALRSLCLGKDTWCTEVGWHTAPSRKPYGPFGLFSKKVQFDNLHVAQFFVQEEEYHHRWGCRVMVWYQISDGAGEGYEDKFGIFDKDGKAKPITGVFKSMKSDWY